MDHENYINEALEIVSSWEIEEEDFAQAVNDQARLMAGIDLERSTNIPATSPYSPLQF